LQVEIKKFKLSSKAMMETALAFFSSSLSGTQNMSVRKAEHIWLWRKSKFHWQAVACNRRISV